MNSMQIDDFIAYESVKGYAPDTVRVKRRHIEAFCDFFSCEIGLVDTEAIGRYVDHLKERGIAPVKINLVLTHLSQFYDYLIAKGTVILNPVKPVPRFDEEYEGHSGVFSEEDIRALLAASQNHFGRQKSPAIMTRDRAIIELLYSTGIRMNELLNLDVDDVDFDRREVRIAHPKGDDERIVPVGDEALHAVKDYLSMRDRLVTPEKEFDALFISRQGNRIAGITLRRMIHRRKQEAGITAKGTTHAFRRSFASHLLSHGAPITALARILGHRNLGSTEVYTPIDEKDLGTVHEKAHPFGRGDR